MGKKDNEGLGKKIEKEEGKRADAANEYLKQEQIEINSEKEKGVQQTNHDVAEAAEKNDDEAIEQATKDEKECDTVIKELEGKEKELQDTIKKKKEEAESKSKSAMG